MKPRVTFATLNARGLGGAQKLLQIKKATEKIGILCLQETHEPRDRGYLWKKKLGRYGLAMSVKGTGTKGVATLLNEELSKMNPELQENSTKDAEGRTLISLINTSQEDKLIVANTYCPNMNSTREA